MADPNPLAMSPIRGPCRTIAAPCLLLALAMVLDAPGPARALQPCTSTTALQPAAGAQFGCSVATHGTAAAVGAMRDSAAAPAAGAIYVLQRGGEVRLTAGDAGAGDQLGFSVAVGGDALAGGAPFAAAPGAAHAGAIYVFSARDGAWSADSPQVKLAAPDAQSGDHFGQTLAMSGDRIAVGAPNRTGAGGSFSGAVYLFQRSAGGAWTFEVELADPDAAPFDGFGYSVALDGDVLAVGAPFADGPGGSLGAVHVFVRGENGWHFSARLTASDGANGDELGVAVALDGGTLVAGARRADLPGRVDAGAAYVFTLDGGAWSQTAKLTAPSPGAGDLFGSAVAVAGRRVVVGARFHGEGAPNAGAVYVFDPVGAPPAVVLGTPPQAGAELGAAVAASGDAVVASASLADVGGAVDAGSVLACPSPLASQPQGAAVFTITNTDGMATYRPGQPVAYTIVVTNVGSAAGTAHVTTAVAGQLRGAAWCRGAGCTPSHPGDVDDTVVLSVGESATYTVAGRVRQALRTAVVNRACVGGLAGVPAPVCASDVDVPLPDLKITKTDGRTSAFPGQTLLYTVTVTNAGNVEVAGARVTDPFPAGLEGVKWCRGAGCTPVAAAGALDDRITLAPGDTVTYRVQGIVAPSFTGALTNVATVALPPPLVDATPGDNVAQDVTLVFPAAGVTGFCAGIDGQLSEGGTITYTFVLRNGGPNAQADNPGDEFTDVLPLQLTLLHAAATSGAVTTSVAVTTGHLTVHWNGAIPVGGAVTITVVAAINPGTLGMTICNQGALSFDADGDGINESSGLTDDPALPGPADPCCFRVLFVAEVPTLAPAALVLLALLLIAVGLWRVSRRGVT